MDVATRALLRCARHERLAQRAHGGYRHLEDCLDTSPQYLAAAIDRLCAVDVSGKQNMKWEKRAIESRLIRASASSSWIKNDGSLLDVSSSGSVSASSSGMWYSTSPKWASRNIPSRWMRIIGLCV